MIEYIDELNVVERSEYEKLKKENIELEMKYDNAMDLFVYNKQEAIKLRDKIDKAIEQQSNDYIEQLKAMREEVKSLIHEPYDMYGVEKTKIQNYSIGETLKVIDKYIQKFE